MATYAVGDVQGCGRTLDRLLALIRFDAARDRLWLVGDLVNRGPRSLDVLRRAKGLGDVATVVLGNHDVHLLVRAEGLAGAKEGDTLDEILAAPDREALLEWLATRPFLHREGDRVLVHAGLHKSWTLGEAEESARHAEALLGGPRRRAFLQTLRQKGAPPADAEPAERDTLLSAAATVRILTRIRTCRSNGEPCDSYTGPPEKAPAGCVPWFRVPKRASAEATVVFGHWAALGLVNESRLLALDTGCVWGHALTAVRLEDRAVYQVPNVD